MKRIICIFLLLSCMLSALALAEPAGVVPVRHIIGNDDRVRVKATDSYPYSAICYMKGKFRCGCGTTSTGFMVSRNTLLTAAHCMICQKHNEHAKSMTFYFGYRNGKYLTKYSGTYHYWWGTDFPDGYTNAARSYDYCYIRFDKNIGDTTGWFGLSAASDSTIEGRSYTLSGYKDGKLTTNSGTCRTLDGNIVEITMDTLPGNSGSPIYDPGNTVVAFWVSYSNEGTRNYALRITQQLIDSMRREGLFDAGQTEQRQQEQKTSGRTVKGTGGSSNIRSSPSLNGTKLGTLPEGGTAEYLGDTRYDDRGVAWYYIRYDGKKGWVSSRYTTLR